MGILENQKELIENFKSMENWEDKYRLIIDMGKQLKDYPEEYRTDKYKINGCQSQVWFHTEFNEGKIYLQADSDAMIVKGLAAMLLKVYSGHCPSEILASPPKFLEEIGIAKHLSPTRSNGLNSMLKQIQMYAVAFKALEKKQSG
ncbi:cysteine desulfuration protein SufE [bacterium BMS3Abin04]|nr:cysteine desulfuration protein SufE [bacterium BMS3Abin04]